jgi:hypothetical protein
MGGQVNRVVAQLVEALRVLADVPTAQLDWLARYLRESRARTEGDFRLDELALQFEDAAQALPQFLQDGLLRAEQGRAVAAVTAQLSAMRHASLAHLWRAEALGTSREWADVRRKAKLGLAVLQPPPE